MRKGLIALLVILLVSLAFIKCTNSLTQLTFLLDLNNANFNFSENRLNDSSLFKSLTFSGDENITVWISMPKNSTILNSRIDVEGIMKPIQSSTLQQIYSLATGNVNFTNEWDEIIIGTSGPSYVRLLNSTGNLMWSYSVGGDVYGVDIGNLSSDAGNEVAAGSADYKIYLLNSSGNEKWNVNVGNTIYDIDAGNVNLTNEWDEIAVAVADNRVYLFNATGSQMWDYQGSSPFKGVGIGNLSSDIGDEIAAGSGNYVYLLNSSGNEKWNVNVGTGINDVDVGDTILNNELDEIAVAGNNGTVFLLNASGNILWSFSAAGGIDTVSIGEITSEYSGNEVAAGSYDDKVYVLNSTGNLVWSYSTENDVRGIDIGNLTSDVGSEVAAGTNVPASYTLFILNFEYYPTNPYVDIGNDGDLEWQYSGKLRTNNSISNNNEFQDYLLTCNADGSGRCDVPLVFHSDFSGVLNISFLNITYSYNISNIISYSIVDKWSRVNNVWANESVGSKVKNITYIKNPSSNIEVRYLNLSDSATKCDFNGTSYSVTTINGRKVCDISSVPRIIPSSGLIGYDWLWDDLMNSGIPVYKNETSGSSQSGFWRKNITIWNDTATVFTYIISNTTLDETYVTGYSILKVDWYNNGTLYNITPTPSQNNCNTTPTYSQISVGSDAFYVCKQDQNGNGIIDLFVWKQPHTNKTFTIYEVSGSANNPSLLNNFNITPVSGLWGTGFNISVNVTDAEGDNVTVSLCLNLTHIFNSSQINMSNIVWSCGEEKNTTEDTNLGQTLYFNLTSNNSWAGINLFRFMFRDFNDSTIYHEWDYTNVNYGPNVTKHNVTVNLIQGNASSVNRSESVFFLIQVNDTENNQPINNANCSFWVSLNDTNWDWGYNTLSNSTGHCNYSFTPNASYTPGLRWWKGGIYQNNYYEDNISVNYSVEIYGKISLNITQDTFSQNATRNQTKTLRGIIFDEYGQNVRIVDYNCSWYLNGTYIGSALTNSSGYCNYSWLSGCSNNLGKYSLNVSMINNVNTYYLFNKTEDVRNITLKDNLNVTISSPSPSTIFHRSETINLNSTLQDSCGLPSYSYNVSWKLNCTTEPGVYPEGYYNVSGDNTTWSIECFPGILKIIPQASGEFYNLGEKNISIDVYGWSKISIFQPNNGTYNRTENNRLLNISCIVEDANSSMKLEGYTVDILNKYDDSSYTKLTTKNTGANGFANYSWNISSNETVPEGWYTIKCNITHQALSSMRKYNASISEDVVSLLLIEKDTTPPSINWYRSNPVSLGNNASIEANVTDWYGVDKVWVNLTYPNKTSQILQLQNTTADIKQAIWVVNLTNVSVVGDYDFILYANDTSNFTSHVESWYEVYQSIQMYATTDYPVRFTLFRAGKNSVIHSFTNSSGSYNFTLHKRNYDFLAEIEDYYSQKHSVEFYDLNSTATSENQFGSISNITNPLNLSTISLSLVDPPVPWRHELAAFSISTNFVYSNLTVSINYSNKFDETDYEPGIRIYKCSNWTDNACGSGWSQVNSTINTTSHIISTTQTSASAYYAFEPEVCGNNICGSGESCNNCPGDCGECGSGGTTGTTLSPSGGSSGRYSAYCGNGICDSDEDAISCFQDCGTPFSLSTNFTQAYIQSGNKESYSLWITNKLTSKLTASIQLSSSILNFVSLRESEVIVDSSSEKEVVLDVEIPKETESGTYTGEIIVEASGRTERLPVTLIVPSKAMELQLNVKAISKIVRPNETAIFEVTFYMFGVKKKTEVDMSYLIKNLKKDVVIYSENEKRDVETPYSFMKNILIPENATIGTYYIVLNATYDGERISSSDDFEITRLPISSKTIRVILIGTGAILFIIGMLYGRKIFIRWKLSKIRYIFPINLDLLPKGDLNIGKVAEMNVKATFDRNELTTHVLVAGATGSGKSVTGSIFVEELLSSKIPIVVFDPTAQWTGFMRPCKDERILRYYGSHGLTIRDVRSYPGNIYEVTDPKVNIDFKKFMNPGEITVFVLNKLKPGEYDEAVTNIVDSIFRASWEESNKLELVIVFDEVHRLLEKYGGKGGYVALERACREFRKWGIGLVMISQVLSDFKEAIKGNVLTEIQMHTKSLSDLTRIEKKYGLEYARRVAKEEIGIGMIQNPKYNKGLPWFISLRPPLHMPHKILDIELEMYKQYNSKIEKIEQEIQKLEKSGRDVLDLKIEAKLAKDKLKKGMFRVSEIYIESLTKKLGLNND